MSANSGHTCQHTLGSHMSAHSGHTHQHTQWSHMLTHSEHTCQHTQGSHMSAPTLVSHVSTHRDHTCQHPHWSHVSAHTLVSHASTHTGLRCSLHISTTTHTASAKVAASAQHILTLGPQVPWIVALVSSQDPLWKLLHRNVSVPRTPRSDPK